MTTLLIDRASDLPSCTCQRRIVRRIALSIKIVSIEVNFLFFFILSSVDIEPILSYRFREDAGSIEIACDSSKESQHVWMVLRL